MLDKYEVWNEIHNCIVSTGTFSQSAEEDVSVKKKTAGANQKELEILISHLDSKAENFSEVMRYCMDKTVGATDDNRMGKVMKLLLAYGGADVLAADEEFRQNLMKKAQIHENQFVVIYEDWEKAEAYLNIYNLLLESGNNM